jgi:hypothetical protein
MALPQPGKDQQMVEFVAEEDFVPKPRAYSKGPRGPRQRTEEQMEWDEAFSHALNGTGYLHVQVGPEEVQDARKRVASAARYTGKGITEGEARPGRVKGTVLLSWQIRDVKKRKPKTDGAGDFVSE